MWNKLEQCNSIAISGHVHPDGDCVGACLAFYLYSKKKWPEKDIRIFLEPIPDALKLLPSYQDIQEITKGESFTPDAFVALDCGSLDRLGEGAKMFSQTKMTWNLDHHVSNTNFAQNNMVLGNASSTCEVLMHEMKLEEMDLDIATCLYLGMIHDTGVFKHSNTSGDTMRYAGALVDLGVNTAKIIDESFYQKTYIQNQMLGRCLLESMLALDGKVILSCLHREVLDFYQAVPADLDGLIDQLRVTQGTEVAIFAYETEDGVYKVSLRSNGIVDVSRIAVSFGGGGHIKAAGFTYQGGFHDVLNHLLLHIAGQLGMEAE